MTHPLLGGDLLEDEEISEEEAEAIIEQHQREEDEIASYYESEYSDADIDDEDWDAAMVMDFSGDPFYGQELDFNE